MSVEALVISKLAEEGKLKKAFQAGIDESAFELHDEEWKWLVKSAATHQPINPRLLKIAFPEFDYMPVDEKLTDLLEELKRERAYLAISSSIEEVYGDDPLSQENAIDKAAQLRDQLGDVLKVHSPYADVALKSQWRRGYERIKNIGILRGDGEPPGIRTRLAHFDHHFGGLQKETSYLFLGRPGDSKTFTLEKFAAEAAWDGYNVGLFSPEMTEHQHNCRVHTLLSAKPEIQGALGLTGAFRNRSLKDGYGFNIKEYRRFLEYIDAVMDGEIFLFTQRYRREKMSVSYIETRIEDYGLDLVIVDPIYKLRSPRKRGSRWEELGDITDALIDLAHTYNIPVVMSNQANRALVGRKGEAPDKDTSFGADAPVQEANCVIGVKHFSEEHIMKYNCSKNRDGEPFRFTAQFIPNLGIIRDVTPIVDDDTATTNGYDKEAVKELHAAMKEEDARV